MPQGPIIVVSSGTVPFAASLGEMFPIIETNWLEAPRAVEQVQPAAVLIAAPADTEHALEALARQIAAQQLYAPLVVIDPKASLPINAIPFSQRDGNFLTA